MKLRFLALVLSASALLAQTTITAADTAHIVFHSAPLRGGSIGSQIDAAVKDLKKNGLPVKLRAFVTPAANLSAVTAAITKAFPPKSLPVVNLVQIARLPDPAASILLEGVTVSDKIENPNGVAFISGQLTQAPTGAIAPLAERSVASLKSIAGEINLNPEDILRVNCYTSSLADEPQVRAVVIGAFPKADLSIMQIQRAPANQFIECDAFARLHTKPAEPVRLLNPTKAAFAQAAIVTAPKVIFTTTYPSTSNDDAGVQAALNKLRNGVQSAKATMDHVFYVYAYAGNQEMLDKFRTLRFDVLIRSNAPASTNLVFEGAAGAALGVDAIAW